MKPYILTHSEWYLLNWFFPSASETKYPDDPYAIRFYTCSALFQYLVFSPSLPVLLANLTRWKVSVKLNSLLYKEGVTACKAVKQLGSSQSTLMCRTFLPEHGASYLFLSKFLGFQWLIAPVFWNPSDWKSSLSLRTTLHYGAVLLLMMMIRSGMSSD